MTGFAVIGAGHWGPNIISNLDKMEGSRVHWVVESDSERRKQVTAHFGERIPSVSSLVDVLGDSRVDGVVIATPTRTHYELGRQALAAGKHVLMEKPLAASSREAEELCRLADEQGLVLMVGHVFIYNAAVIFIKRCLDEGLIGRPLRFDLARTNLGPIRRDVGAHWDLMPHDLSMLRYWLDQEPTSVIASGKAWLQPGIYDAVAAVLTFPNQVQAVIRASWLSARKNRDIEIVGDRQMIFFDDNDPGEPIRIYDKGVEGLADRPVGVVGSMSEFLESTREGDITIPWVSTGQPLAVECSHFADCIESGETPLTSGRDGLAVVRVLEAIDRSLESRQEEAIV